MAPLKKKTKAEKASRKQASPPGIITEDKKASRKQASPPGIITEDDKFSVPLARRLYYEQCAPRQVIMDGQLNIFLRSPVLSSFREYGLEDFLNVEDVFYEEAVKLFYQHDHY